MWYHNREQLQEAVTKHGSVAAAERAHGLGRGTLQNWAAKHGLHSGHKFSRQGVAEPAGATPEPPPPADPVEIVAMRRRTERLEEEVRSLRSQVKVSAKHANLVDDVREILEPAVARAVVPSYRPPPRISRATERAGVSLILHVSDLHWGEIVDPQTIHGINAYSPAIAALRLEYAWDTVRRIADDYRGGVQEIIFALNGDTIGGAIHPESTEYYAGVAIQTLDAAGIIAQLGAEASQVVRKVRFLGTTGNHPRSTQKVPTGKARVDTSWETVVHAHAAALMKPLKNVSYETAKGYTLDTTIGPSRWAFSHGDAARGGGGQLGIPAYGLKKQHDAAREWSVVLAQLQDAAVGGIVRHTRFGHFHTYFAWQAGAADICLAPSPKGADPYVLDSLGKYSPPQLLVEVVHPEHDVIGSHLIDLTHVREGTPRWEWNHG